jgi:hypothetical protein
MLFRRRGKQEAAADNGIAAFWGWWPEARLRIEAAIKAGEFNPIMAEITARLNAIHEDLGCELTSGLKSRHAFCISGRGNRAIRPVAERWLAMAPAQDATWEFHAARQPGRRHHDEFGGHVLAESDYRLSFHLDARVNRLDVAVFHPELADLPESKRLVAISLFLSDLLGEDDAERWIGKFESAPLPPDDSVDAAGLRAEVTRLRALPHRARPKSIEGVDPKGRPIRVLANLKIKRIDHILEDQHGTVAIRLAGTWPHAAEVLDSLDALEDRLEHRLAETATWVARTTKPGLRTIHFVARDNAAARQIIESWAGAHPTLNVTTSWESDPEWLFRAEWNGVSEMASVARETPGS